MYSPDIEVEIYYTEYNNEIGFIVRSLTDQEVTPQQCIDAISDALISEFGPTGVPRNPTKLDA